MNQKIISNAAALMGAKGGAAGTGKAKRRSKEFYVKLSAMGVAKRLAEAKKIEAKKAEKELY